MRSNVSFSKNITRVSVRSSVYSLELWTINKGGYPLAGSQKIALP